MAVLAIPRSMSGFAGDIGEQVERDNEAGYEYLEKSDFLGLVAKGVFRRLFETFQKCSEAKWDGVNAQPVSLEAFRYSWFFLDSLPLGIEAPDVSAEPDGSITLEWYSNPRKVISISIDSDGWLDYAALIGISRRHGRDSVQMDISDDLVDLINRVMQSC